MLESEAQNSYKSLESKAQTSTNPLSKAQTSYKSLESEAQTFHKSWVNEAQTI